MKKQALLLTISLTLTGLSVQSQTFSVPNANFENWTNVGGTDYLNDWNVSDTSDAKNFISKVTDAAEGNFALRFGTYPGLYAPYVEIYDSIPDGTVINQIEFKLKTGGIVNTFTDGAVVSIYKYDKDWDYLTDQIIRVAQNTGGWAQLKQGTNMNGVKYILLSLQIWDFSKTGVYAIFDDIKFTKTTVGIESPKNSILKAYPNPTTDYFILNNKELLTTIQITNQQGQVVKKLNDISSDGQIDISELAAGVYTLQAQTIAGAPMSSKLIKQ